MDSDRDLDIANFQAIIGLWQQEEQRLHSIISNPMTSAEVRSQANYRLDFVLEQIREAADDLTKFETGR